MEMTGEVCLRERDKTTGGLASNPALSWTRKFFNYLNLYEKQEMREKRRLLDFVFSNSIWKNGCLIPAYRKPFDMMAVTNGTYQKEKAARGNSDGLFTIWLPGPDSNQRPIG